MRPEPVWSRLRESEDFQRLFECETVAARCRQDEAKLIKSDESDPAKLGRARGFLEAIDFLRHLPEKKLTNRPAAGESPPADDR
jgi:hypothetical protein